MNPSSFYNVNYFVDNCFEYVDLSETKFEEEFVELFNFM